MDDAVMPPRPIPCHLGPLLGSVLLEDCIGAHHAFDVFDLQRPTDVSDRVYALADREFALIYIGVTGPNDRDAQRSHNCVEAARQRGAAYLLLQASETMVPPETVCRRLAARTEPPMNESVLLPPVPAFTAPHRLRSR